MWRDVHSIKYIWHYLVCDKEISSSKTDRDIEKLRAEKIALIKEIESATEFPPRESLLCNWCSYQSICPLWKHLLVIESLPEKEVLQEKGIQLVDRLERLQSERREIETQIEEKKEALFEYSDREGVDRIFGSAKVAKIKREIKLSFPDSNDERRTQLEKVIRESGKWNEVSLLDVRKLATKVEEGSWRDEVLKRIEKFGEKEEKKAVTLVKKKEREE